MDFYAFNCLPRDDRAQLVWIHGCFLAIRQEAGCSVVLYHLGEFFAEVWYCPENNQVKSVCGFKNRRLLELYLEVIDLEGLLE